MPFDGLTITLMPLRERHLLLEHGPDAGGVDERAGGDHRRACP
jgi:hypothetical protein